MARLRLAEACVNAATCAHKPRRAVLGLIRGPMDALLTSDNLIALVTLTALEVVLGVDNVIFISILAGKLRLEDQARARRLGLLAAMVMRILLLFSLAWIVRLTEPLFSVFGRGVSGRDLILLGGGLFLLAKATLEIHEKLEGVEGERSARVAPSFGAVIIQIMLLDIVFSLDSVITAVGMAESITVMVIAVVLAVGIMMVSAGSVSEFVQRHPTVKVLALSFLLLIGMSLVGEGLGQHIPKGYIYFAMAFSVFVEMINLRVRKHGVPVDLHEPYTPEPPALTPAALLGAERGRGVGGGGPPGRGPTGRGQHREEEHGGRARARDVDDVHTRPAAQRSSHPTPAASSEPGGGAGQAETGGMPEHLRWIWRAEAPSAMRMAISRVRCATRNAIRP